MDGGFTYTSSLERFAKQSNIFVHSAFCVTPSLKRSPVVQEYLTCFPSPTPLGLGLGID
jgi:hypothetical protein